MPVFPSRDRDYLIKGVLPILVASAVWAFAYLIRKLLLQEVAPPVLTAAISPVVAVFIYAVYRPPPKTLWKHFKAHKWGFIGLSLSGVFAGSTLMLVGLDHLDLGVATTLEKLQPIFTLFLAAWFLKERLSRRLIPYCLLAVVSSYFVSVARPFDLAILKTDALGIAAVTGAAFCWGVSSVIGRSLLLSGITAVETVFFRFAITAIAALPFLLLSHALQFRIHFTWPVWGMIIGAGILGNGGGFLLYYMGLKHVDAPTAGFLELVTPVVSIFLGMGLLGEHLTPLQSIAIPVMLFAVYRITAAPKDLPVIQEASELP